MATIRKIKIEEPILVGERVLLRLPIIKDASAIADYMVRNRAFHKPTDPSRPEDHFAAPFWRKTARIAHREFQLDGSVRLILMRRDEPTRVIGSVNFNQIVRGIFQACYLGYAIDEHEQSQGLMTEALRVSIGYMFGERNLHRIMANYMPENAKSARVLEKLGFVIEGRAQEYLRINGRWREHVLTSLTNQEWRER